MKVSILQTDIVWADISANLSAAEKSINESPKSDLYILPEMFSTGFCTEPDKIADSKGVSLSWMQRISAQTGSAICGSVAIEQDGKFYNRFYFVKPSGETISYDKKHLFTYGCEDKRYTAGDDRVIVEYLGVRILLLVCYDLRFPVWSRNRKDYDMIIYVASWPIPRIDVWKTLIKARAIENQCYVAAVNRVGKDPSCEYNGASAVIDPYGRILAGCDDNIAMSALADIDMETLEKFREKFPVLNDADSFGLD